MILLLAACTGARDWGPPPPGDPVKNVLMVSIDTLRRDHVDRYATDGVERMPFLSTILADGLALDAHRQCSDWTFHSMSCTTLGRPVEEIGWTARINDQGTPMPDGQPTLARRLADVGFYTALRSTNGWFSPDWNTAQGYTQVIPETSGALTTQFQVALAQAAADLAAEPDRRWFVHVHVIEPHAPYDPPEEYLEAEWPLPPVRWDLSKMIEHYAAVDEWPTLAPDEQALLEQHLRARYDGELRWLDDQLSDVWDQLTTEGWLDDTVFVVWSDHGEQFWEHGHASHAWTLGPEEVDGILGFWIDGREERSVDTPTHAVDLVPTVLAYLGLPIPNDGTLPGHVAGAAPAGRLLFSNTAARAGGITSVNDGWYELDFDFDEGLSLYDVRADPGRTVDLWAPSDPHAVRLWKELRPKAELLSSLTPDLPVSWPDR